MSCDGNRGKFFHHIAQDQAVQNTFGSPADAESAFEQIFNTARAQSRPGNVPMRAQAEARTRKLFDEMCGLNIKPPTHSPTGLPRKDAQFGYAAIHQTLEAIRSGQRLPGLARQVIEQRGHTRRISAVRDDANGYFRCTNCGRFASRTRGHNCPATATRQTMEAHLHRRLGIPATAYGEEGINQILAEAKASGGVRMRHGLTGETIEASLDGLPLALATGFVPDGWNGQTKLVELPGGRVVGVLNPDGLQQIHPSGNAVAVAGAAYGLVIQPGTPIVSATSIPSIPHHTISSSAATDVSGGQVYDLGHFIGTEYRKRDTLGTDIDVNGVRYTIGDRSRDPADWSSARHAGLEPPPKGGVAVGRTLVEAVGILSTGQVVETADGHIQVYDAKRENLLAVYDPGTGVAGDTDGTPNASAAQMAAVLAHHALHPQNQYDAALLSCFRASRTIEQPQNFWRSTMKKTTTPRILGACYVRTATITNNPSFSLEAQIEQIKACAAAEGVEIIKIYFDEATSAHKTKYRPGIMKMLDDARKGEFSILYVHKIDRLARHLEWAVEIIKQLQQANIMLKAVEEENFDLATPEGKLMFHLLASLGEFYSDGLSKKISTGKRGPQHPPILSVA